MNKRFLKDIVKRLLLKIFKLGLKFKIVILPDHYYIPISNILNLKKNKNWQKKSTLNGIKINLNNQLENIRKIVLPFKEEYKNGIYYFDAVKQNAGPGFGVIEAQALYGAIRYYSPKKIIEIGSGTSTFIMLTAGAKNITCVEPYPSDFLTKNKSIKLINRKLENCDPELFLELKEGDFLFIDSSHTLKIGSDVSQIYLEILPILNPGVIIHIHDIYFPYNYQRDADNAMLQWMETQLLQALLTNNSKFEILFCMSHLHYEFPKELKSIFPMYTPQEDINGIAKNIYKGHFPSSIYLVTK